TNVFFQAEDGIRDRNVTGVQTCALPICRFTLFTYSKRRIFCAYWPEWMWKNDDIKNDQSLNRCFERRNCYRWSTYWRLRYSRIALGDWLCTATNRPVSAHDNCRKYCDRS